MYIINVYYICHVIRSNIYHISLRSKTKHGT